MIFLIEYDRGLGRIITIRAFAESERNVAEAARLETELGLNRGGIEREVVLLEAANEKALRRTHRRYFEKLSDLANTS